MSGAVPPFSPVGRGRLPAIPPAVRIVGLGLAAVGIAAAGVWYVSQPSAVLAPQTGNSFWSPGPELKLPALSAAPAPAEAPAPAAAPVPAPAPPKPPEAPAIARRMVVWGDSTPTFAAGARTTSGATSSSPGRAARVAGQDEDGRAEEPTTEYGQRMQPTRTAQYRARAYANISWLMPQSTTFDCMTNSPISTQLVGGVSCTVTDEVWSADGTNRLLDRGAIVSGEIQRGLGQGQDRAFILWTRVRSGSVMVELNSPAADRLGQIGAPGIVDEHLWQKLKGAVLLTGIEGLSSAGTALASQGGGNNYLNLSSGRSLAQESLQHDINIPSTLWLGQGTVLKVYVQHDIWFDQAYRSRVIR